LWVVEEENINEQVALLFAEKFGLSDIRIASSKQLGKRGNTIERRYFHQLFSHSLALVSPPVEL